MKAHTKAEVSISLSESDIDKLREDGKIEEDGVIIELYT